MQQDLQSMRGPMRGAARRQAILAAALECFVTKGFAATGIDDIRQASGASVGSIYHFFGSKEGIALALYTDAVRRWTEATLDLPVADGAAETIVRLSVARAIEWAVRNPRLHRFLMQARWLEPVAAGHPELAAVAAAAHRRGAAVLAVFVAQGAIRPLPWDVYQSLVLGPAHDYLALHFNGQAETGPADAARLLGDAAWAAVRAI